MIATAEPRTIVQSQSTKHKNRAQRRQERARQRRMEAQFLEESETRFANPEHEFVAESVSTADPANGVAADDKGEDSPEASIRPGLMRRLFGGGQRGDVDRPAKSEPEQRPGLLRPIARREFGHERTLQTIRHGFEDLSDLMGDIRDGLDSSVQRQGELLEQLKFLPVVAEQNAKAAERSEAQFKESNRLQGEAVRTIKHHVTAQREQTEQLERIFGTITRESRDQKRDIEDVHGRLERMRESDQAIANGLSTVSSAIRKVSEQGVAQNELASRIQAAFDERTQQIEQTIKRQSSRQGWFMGLTFTLAFTALAGVSTVGYFYLKSTGAIAF